MRRFALLSLTLALPAALTACGSPFEGFGGFIGDTNTFELNPNRPVGDSENLRRVTGRGVNIEPLLPEPGNVWPGPPPKDPTLEDIEKQQNQPLGSTLPTQPGTDQPLAPHPQPRPVTPQQPQAQEPFQPQPTPSRRRGSSTPPSAEAPVPQAPPYSAATPPPVRQAQPGSRTVQTPQGPAVVTPGSGGVQTYTPPGGGGVGLVVPNGNGTSTLIGPDGSVQTVPSPR